MASLHFKGKTAVWNHHLSVPYRTLEKSNELSLDGENHEENLIIEGDNLLALKSLLPKYQGEVKCIYIDPPYNTGEEGWVYNDNVNSPIIKNWIGKTVGGDDLTRHDKWLSMMTPRLKLLWSMLQEDGVMFVSIDNNEMAHLKLLMDEIAGDGAFVTAIHVEMSTVQGQKVRAAKKGNIVKNGEYILVYSKNKNKTIGKNILYDLAEYDPHYSMYLVDKGDYYDREPLTDILCEDDGLFDSLEAISLAKESDGKRVMSNSDLTHAYRALPDVKKFILENSRKIVRSHDSVDVDESDLSYSLESEQAVEYNTENRSYLIYKNSNDEFKQLIRLEDKVHEADDFYQTKGVTTIRGDWWDDFYRDMGNVSKEGGVKYSNGKKPVRLIKQLIKFVSDGDDVILDSFAGSGTTAQAVTELNLEDGKNRKFVLVQMREDSEGDEDKNVCRDVTRKRIEKAINSSDSTTGFSYHKLGPVIDEESILKGDLPEYDKLAKYVYYLATGNQHPDEGQIDKSKYLAGKKNEQAVYLMYENDFDELKKLAITYEWAQETHASDKRKKIVYAPGCYLKEEELKQFNMKFVNIPYNLFESQ